MIALQLSDSVPLVEERIKVCKDVHVLISRSCDFTNVIKVKDLDMEKLSWVIQEETMESHKSLKGENFPAVIRARESAMEAKSEGCYLAVFEDGGRGLEPKNEVASWN